MTSITITVQPDRHDYFYTHCLETATFASKKARPSHSPLVPKENDSSLASRGWSWQSMIPRRHRSRWEPHKERCGEKETSRASEYKVVRKEKLKHDRQQTGSLKRRRTRSCRDSTTGATSGSGTFLDRETRKRIGEHAVAFVTRGTAAITCQLGYRVSRVSLPRERAHRGGHPDREITRRAGRGPLAISRWDSWCQLGSQSWLRPATWLVNECRTMGGSAHRAAHRTCLHVYRRVELHRGIQHRCYRYECATRDDTSASEVIVGRQSKF